MNGLTVVMLDAISRHKCLFSVKYSDITLYPYLNNNGMTGVGYVILS